MRSVREAAGPTLGSTYDVRSKYTKGPSGGAALAGVVIRTVLGPSAPHREMSEVLSGQRCPLDELVPEEVVPNRRNEFACGLSFLLRCRRRSDANGLEKGVRFVYHFIGSVKPRDVQFV